jgi:hypothetical protein
MGREGGKRKEGNKDDEEVEEGEEEEGTLQFKNTAIT